MLSLTAFDARMLSCISVICVYKLRRIRRFVRLILLLGLVRCFAEFLEGY